MRGSVLAPAPAMKWARVLVSLAIVAALAVFFASGGAHYLSLDYFQSRRAAITAWQHAHPIELVVAFFVLCTACVAVSVPGPSVLAVVAGAVFGVLWGTVLVSFASTIGSTIAFLLARFVFRDAIGTHFARRVRKVNAAFERRGVFYLFTLRLEPVIPSVLVNWVMGLTTISVWRFYWVTQIGGLAGILIYANVGTQIGRLTSPDDLLSPRLIGALVLLGLFPFAMRWLIVVVRARRRFRIRRR